MVRWAAAAILIGLAGGAHGQTIALPDKGVLPPQVIPSSLDPGTPAFTVAPGATTYGSDATAPDPGVALNTWAPGASSGQPIDRGDVLASLQQQSYGATAVATADKLGLNSTGVAAFAAAESDFRNIATGNGSTSATGPWQITSGTWDDTVKRFSLPYTAADRVDPNAQAVVSSYLIRSYGGATSQALGQVATVQQTYGSYVFGPTAGAKLAQASPDTPLANIVPASFLSNNGMAGWSVKEWNTFSTQRLGTSATQPIFAAGT